VGDHSRDEPRLITAVDDPASVVSGWIIGSMDLLPDYSFGWGVAADYRAPAEGVGTELVYAGFRPCSPSHTIP
jgi:hypothetical protein